MHDSEDAWLWVHFPFCGLLISLHFFGGIAYSKLQVPVLKRGGWERRILLRSVPFGISSEALIGCGHFLCLGFRFSFLSLMIDWMDLDYFHNSCKPHFLIVFISRF